MDATRVSTYGIGPSPRVRGSHGRTRFRSLLRGVIPVRGGRRGVVCRYRNSRGVIPARAGAGREELSDELDVVGSSPRARGRRGRGLDREACRRFIPARAGPISKWTSFSSSCGVHPRFCLFSCKALTLLGLRLGLRTVPHCVAHFHSLGSPPVFGCCTIGGRGGQRDAAPHVGPTSVLPRSRGYGEWRGHAGPRGVRAVCLGVERTPRALLAWSVCWEGHPVVPGAVSLGVAWSPSSLRSRRMGTAIRLPPAKAVTSLRAGSAQHGSRVGEVDGLERRRVPELGGVKAPLRLALFAGGPLRVALVRLRRTGLPPPLHRTLRPQCPACCASSPSAAATAPTPGCSPASPSSTARYRRLDARHAPRPRAPRPHRGHRGPRRTRLDPRRQLAPRRRLAHRHRRPQPGRGHLRPPPP